MHKSISKQVKTIAVIQARIRSERLPGKSVLPLCGIPMLSHIVDRAAGIDGVSKVIVATGNRNDNARIEEILSEGTQIFFGDDFDVLSRYYHASKPHQPDYVIRITGDNPFTDTELAASALTQAVSAEADLASISGIPVGTAVEIIRFSALETAFKKADTDYQHEHVTPYIKEHPELFRIFRFDPPESLHKPAIRLTVDTSEDFSLAKAIYDNLYRGTNFSLKEVLDFLDGRPDLLLINKDIVQRPMTHSQKRGGQ